MKKVKAGGISMIMKIGMGVAQYYTFFNYGPPIPQKDLNPQDRKIVAGPGMKPATTFFPRSQKRESWEGTPQMCLSWIIWKHRWPPQCKKLVETQLEPLW